MYIGKSNCGISRIAENKTTGYLNIEANALCRITITRVCSVFSSGLWSMYP
jgi:hypothetical protein